MIKRYWYWSLSIALLGLILSRKGFETPIEVTLIWSMLGALLGALICAFIQFLEFLQKKMTSTVRK